jgi:hypothetical protein
VPRCFPDEGCFLCFGASPFSFFSKPFCVCLATCFFSFSSFVHTRKPKRMA